MARQPHQEIVQSIYDERQPIWKAFVKCMKAEGFNSRASMQSHLVYDALKQKGYVK